MANRGERDSGESFSRPVRSGLPEASVREAVRFFPVGGGERDTGQAPFTKTLRSETIQETVAEEFALTVYADGAELVTLVGSPTDLEELLMGFLTSESVIDGPKDVRWMAIDPERGEAWVTTRDGRAGRARERLFRHPVVASCCGRARVGAYFASDTALLGLRPFPAVLHITPSQVTALMKEMEERTRRSLFGMTGGVHSALLARPDGEVLALRNDIGRHNALDKLYGYSLMQSIDTGGTLIAFSGRISSEVLLKVAKIGSPILVSKAAPTSLALDWASELGLTTIGFVRGDRITVYTGRERVESTSP